jgi:hypothetical protein
MRLHGGKSHEAGTGATSATREAYCGSAGCQRVPALNHVSRAASDSAAVSWDSETTP